MFWMRPCNFCTRHPKSFIKNLFNVNSCESVDVLSKSHFIVSEAVLAGNERGGQLSLDILSKRDAECGR